MGVAVGQFFGCSRVKDYAQGGGLPRGSDQRASGLE